MQNPANVITGQKIEFTVLVDINRNSSLDISCKMEFTVQFIM